MNPRDKLAAARLKAVKNMPYFRAALTALVPKQAPGLGTVGVTEHGVMLWDPEAIAQWAVEETSGVLLHEINHLLRHHGDRCQRLGADRDLWNIAGDLEINDDLIAAGIKLPEEGVWPSKLGLADGLTAEEYYHALQQMAKDAVRAACGGEGEGEAGDGEEGEDGEDGDAGQDVGRGKCGGCAGNPRGDEAGDDAADGRSDVELERVRRTVAEAIRNEAASGRGTVPAGLVRWADSQLKPPQIPWRQKLKRAVRGAVAYRAGAVDLHYTRPSRRQAGIGYGPGKPILPAMRAPVPRVAVAVDTSGSMGEEELIEAISETRGVLSAAGANVTFCACDAAVHELREVRGWEEAAALLKGGGGTDFRPVFDALDRKKPKLDVVVFITDGCGPAPETPPPYKVIWVLVGPHRSIPAPWGEVIELERDGAEAA